MGQGNAHAPSAAGKNKRRLAVVFVLTALYLVAEVVGGLITHSLALLADAGHMLTDVAGLGLALFAIRFAARPASPERTYGYYRVEIFAALANAVVLIFISLSTFFTRPMSGFVIRRRCKVEQCWRSPRWAWR
jgi:cobalt-zinc-cadmium efflux system protein